MAARQGAEPQRELIDRETEGEVGPHGDHCPERRGALQSQRTHQRSGEITLHLLGVFRLLALALGKDLALLPEGRLDFRIQRGLVFPHCR